MTEVAAIELSDGLGAKLASFLDELIREIPVNSEFLVPSSADICYCLELYLPIVVRKRYPEWGKESLDGIYVASAIKTGLRAARLFGTCILISDQTLTPFMVELGIDDSGRSVTFIRIRIGEKGGGSLGISGPPSNSKDAAKLLASLAHRLKDIEWIYKIELSR